MDIMTSVMMLGVSSIENSRFRSLMSKLWYFDVFCWREWRICLNPRHFCSFSYTHQQLIILTREAIFRVKIVYTSLTGLRPYILIYIWYTTKSFINWEKSVFDFNCDRGWSVIIASNRHNIPIITNIVFVF